ncbi:MAG: four helix bundle protein [Verrucomicrobiota bacterium]
MKEASDTALGFAKAFWQLRVYQKTRLLQGSLFEISKSFPSEEKWSLTDQMRRAVRSAGAQIAEAWGKRDYVKHFQSKLSDAEAENLETQHWLITAVDAGYLTAGDARSYFQLSQEIGRMLASMTQRADEFCPDWKSSKVSEPSMEFFIESHELSDFPFSLSTEH